MAKATRSRARGRSGRRAGGTRRKAGASGLGLWIAAGVVLVGGIAAYEHREQTASLMGQFAGLSQPMHRQSEERQPERRQTGQGIGHKALASETAKRTATPVSVPKPAERPPGELAMDEPAFTGTWFLCASRTDNCIVDSATIIHNGAKVRIADIDTPGTKQAKCEDERRLGLEAMMRLKDVLNQGPFTEVASSKGETDGDGRKLRVLMRNGQSVGQQLVREGLARPWTGQRQSWCGQKV